MPELNNITHVTSITSSLSQSDNDYKTGGGRGIRTRYVM